MMTEQIHIPIKMRKSVTFRLSLRKVLSKEALSIA
jgi:hypothetical protein